MQVENWPIDKLIYYVNNPRKNDHVVDNMAAFIKEYGFLVPVIAKSDGLVVDGHLRLKAAKKLGIDTIPVVLADNLSDIQIRALRIAINKSAELAEWDMDMVRLELEALNLDDFDLDLTGFDLDEVKEMSGDDLNLDDFFENSGGDGQKEPKKITCPNCGEEFEK